MNVRAFLSMRSQILRLKIADSLSFPRFNRWIRMGLTVLFAVHCAACNKGQEGTRLRAIEKARLQAMEETRLKAAEAAHREKMEKDHTQALEVARLQKELERSRDKARSEAVGTKMDGLQTLDGKSYTNVEIREASAIGISIRHDSGVARVSYDNLPQAMQERYHFDPKEKEDALVREHKIQEHNAKGFATINNQISEQNKQDRLTIDQEKQKTAGGSIGHVRKGAPN